MQHGALSLHNTLIKHYLDSRSLFLQTGGLLDIARQAMEQYWLFGLDNFHFVPLIPLA